MRDPQASQELCPSRLGRFILREMHPKSACHESARCTLLFPRSVKVKLPVLPTRRALSARAEQREGT